MLFRLFPLVSLFCAGLFLAPVSLGAFETSSKQAILVDAATGMVLFEKNADDRMAPSSMSKMMTIYQVFDALKEGSLSLDDTFLVSEKAWRKGGSKMYVSVNTRVNVEDLIKGVIVQSGNDASIVIAEGLSGSEPPLCRHLIQTPAKSQEPGERPQRLQFCCQQREMKDQE